MVQYYSLSPRSPDNAAVMAKQEAPAKRSSTLHSRNITVIGHRTSVRLEPDMWAALSDICRRERVSIHELCSNIQEHKNAATSLTAAIRVFVMAYFRAAATDDGHERAGHGRGVPVQATTARLRPQALSGKK